MDSSSSRNPKLEEPENPFMDAKPEDDDDDDDDDEEMKLLKVIHEYRMWTTRDPNHGETCMNHFYDKWLKKYNHPQASSSMFDLSVQISELFIRYENQLGEFPDGEVDPSLEDQYDPLDLKKFKLCHEIWKDEAYLSGPCDSRCEQDYSVSDDDDEDDGNGDEDEEEEEEEDEEEEEEEEGDEDEEEEEEEEGDEDEDED